MIDYAKIYNVFLRNQIYFTYNQGMLLAYLTEILQT